MESDACLSLPRVLHICSYYAGSDLYKNLFSSLETLGIRQSVYVFTSKNYRAEVSVPANVHFSPCYYEFERLVFDLKHSRVLRDIKRREDVGKYDVIHAHSLFSNGYIAYRLKQEFGLPYIVAVRNTDVNVFFKYMIHLRRLGVRIMAEASAIVFISKPYKDFTISRYVPKRFRDSFDKKSVVLPNGIDHFWHENKAKPRKLSAQRRVRIIQVGSINRNKNPDATIAACEVLRSESYDVRCTLVGQITEARYLRLLKRYPFIEYIPHRRKDDLIRYYREADIFVMPSKKETFGLVYAEAMSQALPVISTRGQGFDGQFREGEVGYAVDSSSPHEIATRIKDILRDYGQISKRALDHAERYDWRNISAEYARLYSDFG